MKLTAACCALLVVASTAAFAGNNDSLTGFYAGAHLGIANASMTNEDSDCWTECSAYTVRPRGLDYGIQVGQNLVSGNLLYGYLADFTLGGGVAGKFTYYPYGNTYSTQSKFQSAFSLRAKTGLVVDGTALNLTYGPAWGKFQSRLNDGSASDNSELKGSNTPGFVYGVSIDHAIQNNLIVSVEYSHYTFRDVQVGWKSGSSTYPTEPVNYVNSLDTARVALNYKF